MKYGNLTLGQVEALVNKIGGMAIVERILQGGNISDGIVKLLEPTNDVYRVTVDYAKSLKAMIEVGHYDYVDSDITEKHFPVVGSGAVEMDIELIRFNDMISTTEGFRDLYRRGYRGAKTEELLALGASQPDLQRKIRIIAPDARRGKLNGEVVCLCLTSNGSRRTVVESDLANSWGIGEYVAVVRV